MFEFILGLFSLLFFTENSLPLHASAELPSKSFTIKTIGNRSSQINMPWTGHFSANNFRTEDSKNKLNQIKKTLRKVVSVLPREHTQKLDYLEIRNKEAVSRGMANGHKMILNTGTIGSQEELAALFIHEMGHVVDIGKLKGTSDAGFSGFYDGKTPIYENDLSVWFYRISWETSQRKKMGSSPKDFVSGYSMADPFEDFAEHYIFYRLHGEKFRLLAQKSPNLQRKYDFMKYQVFGRKSYQNQKVVVQNLNEEVWDTTLVSYEMGKDLLSKN